MGKGREEAERGSASGSMRWGSTFGCGEAAAARAREERASNFACVRFSVVYVLGGFGRWIRPTCEVGADLTESWKNYGDECAYVADFMHLEIFPFFLFFSLSHEIPADPYTRPFSYTRM